MTVPARVGTVGLVVALVGCGLANVDATGTAAPRSEAIQDRLSAAMTDAPFSIRLPKVPGFEMTDTDYISEPNDPTGHRFSVDVRFAGPDGSVVHVFQTNVSPKAMGETDPVALAGGEQVLVGGQPWTEVTLPNGDGTWNVQLARRFGQVTLSLDAPKSSLAREAAATLTLVEP